MIRVRSKDPSTTIWSAVQFVGPIRAHGTLYPPQSWIVWCDGLVHVLTDGRLRSLFDEVEER